MQTFLFLSLISIALTSAQQVPGNGGSQFAGPAAQQSPPAECTPLFSVLSKCPPPPSILSMLATVTAPPTTTFAADPSAESYQASCVCYDDHGSFRPAYVSSIVEKCASFILAHGGGNVKGNEQYVLSDATFCSRMGDIRHPSSKPAPNKTPAANPAKATSNTATASHTPPASTDDLTPPPAITGPADSSSSRVGTRFHGLYIAIFFVLSAAMIL